MESYVLKKNKKKKKIVKIKFEGEGYQFKPNIKNPNLIQINILSLYDLEATNSILCDKIDRSFRKLAALVLRLLQEEDATSTDACITLDEIAKQKEIIRNKKEFLKKQEHDKYLKRLKILEAEVKEKLIMLNVQEEELEKGHCR